MTIGAFGGDIVGKIEQAPYQDLVAFDCLGRELIAQIGRPLDDKAALRSDRHDDRVLDRLCLHQAEDLGAEILLSIRPANPAASNPAGAHVHALHPRAVDVDFEERPRQRQQVDLAAGELDREIRLWLSGRQLLKIVRPHGLQNKREVAAQDAVLIEACDRIEGVIDRLDFAQRRERGVRGGRIKADLEQPHEPAGDVGMGAQRVFHIGLTERGPGLSQQLGVEAKHCHLAEGESAGQHEAVEAVALDSTGPYRDERLLETRSNRGGNGAPLRHRRRARIRGPRQRRGRHCRYGTALRRRLEVRGFRASAARPKG